MAVMLSVQDLAMVQGCSPRNVQKQIQEGQYPVQVSRNNKNRPKYEIPLDALEPTLQRRYLEIARKSSPISPVEQAASRPLESYTAAEREEIAFWIDTLERWQEYRNKPGVISKAAVDERFVTLMELENPALAISVQILYRKQASYRENDLDGLLDKRGKWRRGTSEIPEAVRQAFLYYYLDDRKPPISRCVEYTRLYLQEYAPELVAKMPSYTTFRRCAAAVDEPVKVLGRDGEKAYYDRCSLYIRRTYEGMESNDWWVADNHTFDIQSLDGSGSLHRLHLTAFFDARSGIFTGCHVTDNPSSQATLIALRKGIQKYGIPRNIYVDNGSEFLTFDVGGRGHRAKKSQKNQYSPPPVFKRLGINMTNALVRNARAKIIERRFRDVKDHISRLFETFTGGNVLERPDSLKGVLKDGRIPTDGTLVQVMETLLDYYMNQQAYNGEVVGDRGLTRTEVYHKHLHTVRRANEEELNLMLMRSSRPQKVGRRGVYITIAGQRLDYISQELRTLMGKEVYLRYDPENLDNVRVYDLEDRFLLEVERDNLLTLPYGASQEQIKAGMKIIRQAEKATKEQLRLSVLPTSDRRSALELVMAQAQMTKEAALLPDSSIQAIELQRANEQPLMSAVGDNVSLERMVQNAKRRNNKQED